jgi:hypothetical protein
MIQRNRVTEASVKDIEAAVLRLAEEKLPGQ